MPYYINADQVSEYIAGLAAGMRFERFPYLSVEVLKNLEDTVRKKPNTFRWDSVQIGDCNGCKWRGREECAMFYRCECGEQHTWESDDDFCSYGERNGT